MRTFLRAIGIGITTAVVAGVLAAFAADVATRANNVSDFEGGRGMFIGFVLIPAAVLLGLLAGAIAAVAGPLEGRGAYIVRQSRAILAVTLIIGGISIVSCVTASRPPLIDGLAAEAQVELRLPAGAPLPDIAGHELVVTVYEPSGTGQYLNLDPDGVEQRDGRAIVPGSLGLSTKAAGRTVTVAIGKNGKGCSFALPIPREPTAADGEWSAWQKPSRVPEEADPVLGAYEVRFRVVAVTE